MPFDGAGNFARVYNFQADRDAGIKIMSARVDGEFDGIATALGQTFLRSGVVAMAGTLLLANNKITGLASGVVGGPGLTFNAEATTGLWLNGVGKLSAAVQGTNRLELNTTGALVTGTLGVSGVSLFADGAVGGPGVGFSSEPTTGMYRIGASKIGFATSGTLRMAVDGNGTLLMNTSTSVNVNTTARFQGVLANDAGVEITRQSATNMALISYNRNGTAYTDLTYDAATHNWQTSGVSRISINAAGQLLLAAGSVGTPGIAFTADTSTGIYRIGASNIGITIGGSKVLDISATGLAVTGQATLTQTAGTAANSGSLVFNGATRNRIDFGTNGLAAPSETAVGISSGQKITLYNGISTTALDYALGVENNFMWLSTVSTASTSGFKFYGGDNGTNSGNPYEIARLTGQQLQLITPVNSGTTTGSGNLYLNNGTRNRIDFNANGTGVPNSTNISNGEKITLYPTLTSTNYNVAIGVDASGNGWNSIYDLARGWSWYVQDAFVQRQEIVRFGPTASNTYDGGANAAESVISVMRSHLNSRSINAGGTINASGADYAEYMHKSPGCRDIAKGDVCGVDVNGQLTREWAEAKSFVVKSSDPAYVGGDTWGSHLGTRPQLALEPTQHEDEADEDFAARDAEYQASKNEYDIAAAEFDAQLEAARATVDRIAFSGQVPCNVTGAFNVGDYIVAQQSGAGIAAVALAESDISFAQYKRRIGKVWAVRDGKAWIDVQHG